jgi:hypothetical protein
MAVSNLDELRKLSGVELITAAGDYITNGEQKIKEARHLRDVAIAQLADEIGFAATARRVGMSLSSVRVIRGRT